MNTLLAFAAIVIIFLLAAKLSNQKARTNSIMIDRHGKRWLYLRKTSKGHLFRNPSGKMQTLINTNIFKGYKFK